MHDASLLSIVTQVQNALQKHQFKLASAESCTGGLVSMLLTEMPGSSAWFECGFITYANQAKQMMLGIDPWLINTHGAVSQEVAQAMAQGALKKSQADFALSITGIAGPQGGTPGKPVGTVCFAWANRHTQQVTSETQFFSGNRSEIRQQAALHALQQTQLLLTSL